MADLTKQDIHISLEKEILENAQKKKNFLILTIPGLGISYRLRNISDKNQDHNISYIIDKNGTLTDFNVLDLNFDKDEYAVDLVDEYFKLANPSQKFAVVVNTPYILNLEKFEKSFFSSRTYGRYYYKVMNKTESNLFIKEINPSIGKKSLNLINDLTGCIPRLSKYLALNEEKLKLNPEKLVKDAEFYNILNSVSSVISRCKVDVLDKIGISKKGKYKSKLLDAFFQNYPQKDNFAIKIHDDLSFSENGKRSNETLTVVEKEILTEILANTIITRERIADLKWGDGSYDEYSDQAINKTMQRLSKKLNRHILTPIPKLGYKIKKRL